MAICHSPGSWQLGRHPRNPCPTFGDDPICHHAIGFRRNKTGVKNSSAEVVLRWLFASQARPWCSGKLAVAAALAVVVALAVLVAVAVVVAVAVGELVLYYLQFCMESIAGISMVFPYPCISYQLFSTSMVRSSFSKTPDIFSVKLARSAAAYQNKWHGNWWKKSEKKNGFSS